MVHSYLNDFLFRYRAWIQDFHSGGTIFFRITLVRYWKKQRGHLKRGSWGPPRIILKNERSNDSNSLISEENYVIFLACYLLKNFMRYSIINPIRGMYTSCLIAPLKFHRPWRFHRPLRSQIVPQGSMSPRLRNF